MSIITNQPSKRDPRLLDPRFQLDSRPRARLSIGKDLDGCYYFFDRAWYAAGVALGKIDPSETPYRGEPRWEFYEDYGFDLDGFLALCHAAADKGLLWSQAPIAGTVPSWQELLRLGHDLHVKTDRSFGAHPIASEVATRMWLGQHGLNSTSITFTADKTSGPAVDMMLEDKLSNYDALDAAGVEVWLIDRSWNQDDGARRRVYNHEEFVRRVEATSLRRGAQIVAENAAQAAAAAAEEECEAGGAWRDRVFA